MRWLIVRWACASCRFRAGPLVNSPVSAVGGRGGRSIAHFAGVWGSLGDDGGQFAGDAGREVDECGEPAGRTATSESASLRLAGVQPRLAANQAPARSATPATNETAARPR